MSTPVQTMRPDDQLALQIEEPSFETVATQFAGTVSWPEANTPAGNRVVAIELFTAIRPVKPIALGQSLTIGRTTESQFCIGNDPQMSRRHFTIKCTQEGGELEDLASTNGTFLNGKRVSVVPLRQGDKVIAGMTVFAIRIVYA